MGTILPFTNLLHPPLVQIYFMQEV